ncbi:MAG: ATPase [Bacteroidales bacterium]|nr:ATPase [Bacteroidales bacterium]
MYYIRTIAAICSIVLLSTNMILGQDKKIVTEEFQVEGVCNMCKSRIENAAYISGVKHCEWNKETELLKVTYNSKKTSLDTIHNSIAAAGHSTSKVEADPEAYSKLPKCCAYKGGAHKH